MKEEEIQRAIKEGEIREVMVDGKIVRKRVVKRVVRRAVPKGSQGESKEAPKTPPAQKPKQKPKRGYDKYRIAIIVAINCAIIAILGGVGLVATHYALQSGTRHGLSTTVPQFESLTMMAAEGLAVGDDLHIVVNDSIYAPSHRRGVILDQIPKKGTVVKPGRTIYVTINATQQKMVEVPYVAGRSLRQAKSMLEVAQLTIDELVYEEDIATNYILAQYYKGASIGENSHIKAPVGSGIKLKVGVAADDDEVRTPMLIGKAFYVAQNELWDMGLNVGEITSERELTLPEQRLALVLGQSMPSDSLIRLGTKIDLELTQDRSLVDTVLFYREKSRMEAEELLLREQQIADSLAMTMVDTMVVEPVRQRAERVDFEDLFN